MQIEKIKNDAISNLQSVIEEINNIQPAEKISREFNTRDLHNEQFRKNFLNEIKNQIDHKKYQYIYTFTLPEGSQIKKIYNRYEETKKDKKSGRAYARLNSLNINRKSSCLYVGTSKSLIKRIKEHLGFGYKNTYAMQLFYWCNSLDFDITLNIYAFNNGISSDTLQAFEDGAWITLEPMLGRQGKR